MREEVLVPAARAALDEASSTDRSRFEHMIREVCVNPSLGQPIRTLTDVLPLDVFRYRDGEYFVAYDLPDEATVRVWMIGRVFQ